MCISPFVIPKISSPEESASTSKNDLYSNMKPSTLTYTNITVISDGYNSEWGWNINDSFVPEIAVDTSNDIHVVWGDDADGIWGDDREIMYANYTKGVGWSNATVVSDGFNNDWGWNTGESKSPGIAVDDSSNLHVSWNDNSVGIWGIENTDFEIIYSTLIIDNDAPSVSINTPTAGVYNSTPLLINASIYDLDTIVTNMKVMINANTPFNISMTLGIGNYSSFYWNNMSEYSNGDHEIIIWAIYDLG